LKIRIRLCKDNDNAMVKRASYSDERIRLIV